MVRICYYISDYGYGHASRSIAIIRRILNSFENSKIFIKTGYPFEFVNRSLPCNNVETIRTENDVGVVFKKHDVVVDKKKTEKSVSEWLNRWEDYVKREKKFCDTNKIDLILSDITPQSFIVSDELGIPGIAISNFTWYYIFSNLFGENEKSRRIKEAYMLADATLVLPFNEEMEYMKKKGGISLVSREVTQNRSDLRKMHGVSDDDFLVFIGVGRSFDKNFLNNMKNVTHANLRILVSPHIELPFRNIIKIPPNVTETQNYIAACDMVVSKAGYGVVSEAVRGKVPLIVFKREGFKEDELMQNEIERNGIGRVISKETFLNGEWIDELENLDKYKNGLYKLGRRLTSDGTTEIVKFIESLMGDNHEHPDQGRGIQDR
jgi:uncharacterized protein (TIGR00661 family)